MDLFSTELSKRGATRNFGKFELSEKKLLFWSQHPHFKLVGTACVLRLHLVPSGLQILVIMTESPYVKGCYYLGKSMELSGYTEEEKVDVLSEPCPWA